MSFLWRTKMPSMFAIAPFVIRTLSPTVKYGWGSILPNCNPSRRDSIYVSGINDNSRRFPTIVSTPGTGSTRVRSTGINAGEDIVGKKRKIQLDLTAVLPVMGRVVQRQKALDFAVRKMLCYPLFMARTGKNRKPIGHVIGYWFPSPISAMPAGSKPVLCNSDTAPLFSLSSAFSTVLDFETQEPVTDLDF